MQCRIDGANTDIIIMYVCLKRHTISSLKPMDYAIHFMMSFTLHCGMVVSEYRFVYRYIRLLYTSPD